MAENEAELLVTVKDGDVPAAFACHRSLVAEPEDAALKVTVLPRSAASVTLLPSQMDALAPEPFFV